jgi:hypothetical protein
MILRTLDAAREAGQFDDVVAALGSKNLDDTFAGTPENRQWLRAKTAPPAEVKKPKPSPAELLKQLRTKDNAGPTLPAPR